MCHNRMASPPKLIFWSKIEYCGIIMQNIWSVVKSSIRVWTFESITHIFQMSHCECLGAQSRPIVHAGRADTTCLQIFRLRLYFCPETEGVQLHLRRDAVNQKEESSGEDFKTNLSTAQADFSQTSALTSKTLTGDHANWWHCGLSWNKSKGASVNINAAQEVV